MRCNAAQRIGERNLARKTRSRTGSGSTTPARTEPPNSADTKNAEGMTPPPQPTPGEIAEGSERPEQWPDPTAADAGQGDAAPEAATEPRSEHKDPAAATPDAEFAETTADADKPFVPDAEPADTLDDPAIAKDQSATEAATGPGGTSEPEAADPDMPELAGAKLPEADLSFASETPDAQRADTPDDPAMTEAPGAAEAAPGANGPEGPSPEASDTAEPVAQAGPLHDQNAQESALTPPSVSEPTAQAQGGTVPPAAVSSSPPPPPPAPKRSIFPLLLGGVLAGGIGFGAQTLLDQGAPAGPDVAGLEAEVAELRAALAAQPAPADLSPLEAELAALRDQITDLPAPEAVTASEDLNAAVDQLRAEFAQAEGIDLAPLESRIQELADILAQQQTTLDSTDTRMTDLQTGLQDTDARMTALQADLDDLRDLAERRVVEAEAAIDAARAQSGLDSLRAALETGVPYRDAVARLTDAGVAVPDAIAGPADGGVATVEALQEGFDDAARNALRVALQDAPTESASDRIGNFLRAQVGARSTVPRAGDDPDAVLSRAAAAMEAGDLAGALAEIEALPDPAQAAMGEWLHAARARIAAQAALPDLTTAITTE